jgi:hypothetical protein|tara:strand:+ start:8 stop:181 length:174 start_codon:yes stop_codon:yes gene_type:complete
MNIGVFAVKMQIGTIIVEQLTGQVVVGGLGALDLDVLYFLPNLPNNPYLSNKSFYYL